MSAYTEYKEISVQQRKALLDQIPTLNQRQDSTMDQLEDLMYVANKIGLYDAADFLKTLLK